MIWVLFKRGKRDVKDGLPLLLRSGADGFRRCLALIDFVLRVAAFGPTLPAAISTGTSDERLSVFSQFFQFHARFDDFPAFTYGSFLSHSTTIQLADD